ncbi:MAG TPA: FtsX-like permease family protein [Planctomycetaceae bacterium]|nr:FtsX-like permease family protein [Planctomycetaceae bacterium]
MNLAAIAFKSLKQRALASVLTGLSVALGVMLMVAVLVIYAVLDQTFSQRSIGYDLIVGPRGSELQLVLSTVYHTNPPIENLPFRYYREIAADPRVEAAIPVALGDVTEAGSFPIVGITPEYFLHDYSPRRKFLIRGNTLRKPFDALIGDRVAKVNGWDVGTEFRMIHGGADTGHVHDEKFTVVGVLAPTGTPNDKSVFVHLDGFYQIQGHDKPFDEAIKREREFFGEPTLSKEELAAQVAKLQKKYSHEGHDHSGHEHFHDVSDLQKEVTSVLLICKNPIAANLLRSEINNGFKAMGVNPIMPMRQLMQDVLGGVKIMLLVLTGLIIAVSGIGIFVSIYNSMAARKREIAIMRALGARRQTVFAIILAESVMLCLGGGLLGLLLGHGLVFFAAPMVELKSGIIMNPWAFEPAELLLIPVLLGLGAIVGAVPGLTAYRTDVSEALQS